MHPISNFPTVVRRAGAMLVGGQRALAIGANGERLFATLPDSSRVDPVQSDDNIGASFYAAGVVGATDGRGPIAWYLKSALEKGLPLYLRGTAHGVGTTRLVTDFARTVNARHRGVAEARVVYASIMPGTKTVRALIDSILVGIEAHLPSRVRVGAGAQQLRFMKEFLHHLDARCLVLDHVDRLTGDALVALGDLLDSLACGDEVRAETRDRNRIGLVLVSTRSPDLLFRGELRVLQRLEGRIVELDCYQRPEDVVEAMTQMSPSLAQLLAMAGAETEAGRVMLERTIGLPGKMGTLFATMERLHGLNPRSSFPELLAAGLQQLPARVALGPAVVLKSGETRRALRLTSSRSEEEGPIEQVETNPGKPKRRQRTARQEVLAQKAKNAERAGRGLRKSLRNRTPAVVPGNEGP